MKKRFCIVGHPLKFSLMQPVLQEAFAAKGESVDSEIRDLPEESLGELFEEVRKGDLSGVLVTRPYKAPACEFMDTLGEGASKMRSVNLVLPHQGGLRGSNTDWVGAFEVLKGVFAQGLEEKKVLILGAGGAARAAAYAAQKLGAEVALWNRTAKHAKEAAESLNLEFVEDMEILAKKPQLVINATAMSDQPSQSTLLPFALWSEVEFAMDAVFGKTSLFLEEAKARNIQKVFSGADWFLYQMLSVFERITGEKTSPELLRSMIYAAPTLEER